MIFAAKLAICRYSLKFIDKKMPTPEEIADADMIFEVNTAVISRACVFQR